MIYQIKDKYYINVAPHIFKEVNLCLKNDDLILVPTNNKIEVYKTYEVKQIFFQNEKESLKKKLFQNNYQDKNINRKSGIKKHR